jgi:hypothetical protein
MSDPSALPFAVRIAPAIGAELGTDELESLAQQLRSDLLDMGAAGVERVNAEVMPERARSPLVAAVRARI